MQASIDCGFMASRVKRPENVAFGLRLRMARENARNGLGYSQQQVAAWLGISYKTVSQYENGGAEFPSRWLPELSRRLGVTVGWFFEIEEAPGVTRNEDREWLGYMGKRLAMLPPGRLRDEYKERLRRQADIEAEFLERLAREGLGEKENPKQ